MIVIIMKIVRNNNQDDDNNENSDNIDIIKILKMKYECIVFSPGSFPSGHMSTVCEPKTVLLK